MEKILLTFITLLGLLNAFNFKGIFHKVISIGITLAMLITWVDSDTVRFISYILLSIMAIVTLIYGLRAKELRTIERNSIIIMGGFLALSYILSILHLPGGGIMKILLLIPIVLTIISYRKHRKLTKEMSFIFFWIVMACIAFINNWF